MCMVLNPCFLRMVGDGGKDASIIHEINMNGSKNPLGAPRYCGPLLCLGIELAGNRLAHGLPVRSHRSSTGKTCAEEVSPTSASLCPALAAKPSVRPKTMSVLSWEPK